GRARAQFDAVLASVAAGGRDAVARAPTIAGLLPDLSACSDVAQLAKQALPPSDPKIRAAIEKITAQIVQVRTATNWGVKDGPAIGDRLVADAEATGWSPLIAD